MGEYTVHFEFSIPLPPNERGSDKFTGNEKFSFQLTGKYDDESSPEQIHGIASETAATVKTFVYNQVGVPFTTDEDGVVKLMMEAFGPKAKIVQQGSRRQAPARRAPAAGGRPPARQQAPARVMDAPRFTDLPQEEQDEILEDLAEFLAGGNQNWYDNRNSKTNPKAPDFKRKSDQIALWDKSVPAWVFDGGGESEDYDEEPY